MGIIDDYYGGYGYHTDHIGTYGDFGHQDWLDNSDDERVTAAAKKKRVSRNAKPAGQKRARTGAAAGGVSVFPAQCAGHGDAQPDVITISDSDSEEDDDEGSMRDSEGDSATGDELSSDCDGLSDSSGEDDDVEELVAPAQRGSRTAAAAAAADVSAHQLVEAALQSAAAAPQLSKFRVVELQAYLRAAGVRTTGLKAELILRVQAHHALSSCPDGARVSYPESSFTYDCTGDACKGDVVLFKQAVYDRFDVDTRHGQLLGYRTVAGTIVKESYGSERQQHTFTVEVLWSTGVQPRRTLDTLLIKGRNLYKRCGGYGVRRRPWDDEAQRRVVLGEKHGRGDAARAIRHGGRAPKRARASHTAPSNLTGQYQSRPAGTSYAAGMPHMAHASHAAPHYHGGLCHLPGMTHPTPELLPGTGLNPHAAAFVPLQPQHPAGALAPRTALAPRQLNGQGLLHQPFQHAFPHAAAAAVPHREGVGWTFKTGAFGAIVETTPGAAGGTFGGAAGGMPGAAGGTRTGARGRLCASVRTFDAGGRLLCGCGNPSAQACTNSCCGACCPGGGCARHRR